MCIAIIGAYHSSIICVYCASLIRVYCASIFHVYRSSITCVYHSSIICVYCASMIYAYHSSVICVYYPRVSPIYSMRLLLRLSLFNHLFLLCLPLYYLRLSLLLRYICLSLFLSPLLYLCLLLLYYMRLSLRVSLFNYQCLLCLPLWYYLHVSPLHHMRLLLFETPFFYLRVILVLYVSIALSVALQSCMAIMSTARLLSACISRRCLHPCTCLSCSSPLHPCHYQSGVSAYTL